MKCVNIDEDGNVDESKCSFFDPVKIIKEQFESLEELDGDKGGLDVDALLVLRSKDYYDQTKPVNAILALIGEYHTLQVGKSSGTESIRDIITVNRWSEEDENTINVDESARRLMSRNLREIDDPDVSMNIWLDCTEIIIDGVIEMGYCAHDIEDGITLTSWINDLQV